MTFIEVCGISFSGDHVPLEGLVYSKLVDWDGRPSARGGGDAIPSGQGVFARTGEYRESRVISVEAAIITDSSDEYFAVKRRVENMPMFGEMRVDQGDGVWVRQVEVEQINIPDAHTRTFTAFTIDVVAPDPVRYRDMLTAGPVGLPSQVGGLVLPSAFPWDFGREVRAVAQVDNTGAVPILPIVTVSGAADVLVVHGGPRRVEFGPFDGELVIDNEARRAFLNGTDVTRQLVRRDWHEAPVGVVTDFWFDATDATPGTALTVAYRIGAW